MINNTTTPYKVVLICPRCHERFETDYNAWCISKYNKVVKRYVCKNILCDGTELLYHKMANDKS